MTSKTTTPPAEFSFPDCGYLSFAYDEKKHGDFEEHQRRARQHADDFMAMMRSRLASAGDGDSKIYVEHADVEDPQYLVVVPSDLPIRLTRAQLAGFVADLAQLLVSTKNVAPREVPEDGLPTLWAMDIGYLATHVDLGASCDDPSEQ